MSGGELRGPKGAVFPNMNAKLAALKEAMILGLPVGSRYYGIRKYKYVFRGTDAVAWLVATGWAANVDDALQLGNALMDRGVFHHVWQAHAFKNKPLFYRFAVHGGTGHRGSIAIDPSAFSGVKFGAVPAEVADGSDDEPRPSVVAPTAAPATPVPPPSVTSEPTTRVAALRGDLTSPAAASVKSEPGWATDSKAAPPEVRAIAAAAVQAARGSQASIDNSSDDGSDSESDAMTSGSQATAIVTVTELAAQLVAHADDNRSTMDALQQNVAALQVHAQAMQAHVEALTRQLSQQLQQQQTTSRTASQSRIISMLFPEAVNPDAGNALLMTGVRFGLLVVAVSVVLHALSGLQHWYIGASQASSSVMAGLMWVIGCLWALFLLMGLRKLTITPVEPRPSRPGLSTTGLPQVPRLKVVATPQSKPITGPVSAVSKASPAVFGGAKSSARKLSKSSSVVAEEVAAIPHAVAADDSSTASNPAGETQSELAGIARSMSRRMIVEESKGESEVQAMREALAQEFPPEAIAAAFTDDYIQSVMAQPDSKNLHERRSFQTSKRKFVQCLAWREGIGIDSLTADSVSRALSCGSLYWCGYDRFRRPIAWVRPYLKDWPRFNLNEELAMHALVLETGVKLMPPGVTEFCMIADTSVLSLSWIKLSFMKGMLSILMQGFPDRLGRLLAGPVNFAAKTAYSMLKPLAPPRLPAKISLMGNPSRELLECLTEEQIPTFMGGTAEHDFSGVENGVPVRFSWQQMLRHQQECLAAVLATDDDSVSRS